MSWETYVHQQARKLQQTQQAEYAHRLKRFVKYNLGLDVEPISGVLLLERDNGEPLFVLYDNEQDRCYLWVPAAQDGVEDQVYYQSEKLPITEKESLVSLSRFLSKPKDYRKGIYYNDLDQHEKDMFEFAYPSCVHRGCVSWDAVRELLGSGTKGQSVHSCCEPESAD